ncbi:MAG: hypothetical protein KYX68_14145 [Flavobacterium sp.]|nr:hypothetical protein [Flavobacterium sp.]
MKKSIIIFIITVCFKSFSQNIKCEIIDYSKTLDGIEYSTYQYVNSSYSYSRPLMLLITDKKTFMEIYHKIPKLFLSKQEYTDIWILGIKDFNQVNSSLDSNKKIIDFFIERILKYRHNNGLPIYEKLQLYSNAIYLKNSDELCNYLVCK